jgi:hypothetical protein
VIYKDYTSWGGYATLLKGFIEEMEKGTPVSR